MDPVKVRKIDFSPDEFIAGIAGMRADDIGVYWTVCSLIYSSGGPIALDDPRIFAIIKGHKDALRASIARLISSQKLSQNDSKIDSKRCENELKLAQKRIQTWSKNALKGGRPSRKNKDIKNQAVTTRARDAELPPPPLSESNDSDSLKKNDTSYLKKKGGRLADDFEMPPEWIEDGRTARARAQLPPADLALEILKFTNYWQTKTGQSATKRDWRKTWVNWCLNAKGAPNGRDPTAPRIPERRGPSHPLTEDDRRRIFNLDRK